MTGRDPRSLGQNECSAFALGLSRNETKALPQVALDHFASSGAVTAAPPPPAKPGTSQRCTAGTLGRRGCGRGVGVGEHPLRLVVARLTQAFEPRLIERECQAVRRVRFQRELVAAAQDRLLI